MDIIGWHSLRSRLDQPTVRVIADVREWLHPHVASDDPQWWTPIGAQAMSEFFGRLPWVEARQCAAIARELIAHEWWQRVGHSAPDDAALAVELALQAQREALADRGDWLAAHRMTLSAIASLPPDPLADVPLSWTLESFLTEPAHVFGLLPGHLPATGFLERWWEVCRARLSFRRIGSESECLELPVRTLLAAAEGEDDPVVRDFALAAFCRQPVPAAADVLARSLPDRTVGVRADFVLQALRSLGPEGAPALPILLQMVIDGDDSPWVAAQLDETIVAVGRGSLSALMRALAHGSWQQRRRLARMLGAFGADVRSIVPFLERWCVHDPSPKVRTAAAEAITAINREP